MKVERHCRLNVKGLRRLFDPIYAVWDGKGAQHGRKDIDHIIIILIIVLSSSLCCVVCMLLNYPNLLTALEAVIPMPQHATRFNTAHVL